MQLGNSINWFEIPVTDFDRAKKFYETIFVYEMPEMLMGSLRMGFFLYDMPSGKVGGAICLGRGLVPSQHGTLVYLNCQPDLLVVSDRVEAAGGVILTSKAKISEKQDLGFWSTILDTEGNKVALHSMS